MALNLDDNTVASFGQEWSKFDQKKLSSSKAEALWQAYFAVFPWDILNSAISAGADIGCGSGRWALWVAPRVARLHLVDPSEAALQVARRNLQGISNVEFHLAGVSNLPFSDASLDFAYSLGVLHHVPDTQSAVRSIYQKLKPGAPLLLYLYYALETRPGWYRVLWRLSNWLRKGVSRSPRRFKQFTAELFALGIYWPLARTAAILEKFDALPASWPLAFYRHQSFYTMRTDALDRLGTPLEQRFSRQQIAAMLRQSGFQSWQFSENPPYWCVAAIK